jgi:hypothetical protein
MTAICLPAIDNPLGHRLGSFNSTGEYLLSFLPDTNWPTYRDGRELIASYLSNHHGAPTISPPFRLLHPDLLAQNILIMEHDDKYLPPTGTGILNWDGAHTVPRYFFWDYPPFLLDEVEFPALTIENSILRQHFYNCIFRMLRPRTAELNEFLQCMEKNFLLSGFEDRVMRTKFEVPREEFTACVTSWMRDCETKKGDPYEGRLRPEEEGYGLFPYGEEDYFEGNENGLMTPKSVNPLESGDEYVKSLLVGAMNTPITNQYACMINVPNSKGPSCTECKRSLRFG